MFELNFQYAKDNGIRAVRALVDREDPIVAITAAIVEIKKTMGEDARLIGLKAFDRTTVMIRNAGEAIWLVAVPPVDDPKQLALVDRKHDQAVSGPGAPPAMLGDPLKKDQAPATPVPTPAEVRAAAVAADPLPDAAPAASPRAPRGGVRRGSATGGAADA